MRKLRLVLLAWLAFLIACALPPPPPKVESPPLAAPIVSKQPARGCETAHETVYLPGVYIDAFPGLPPKAEPSHVVLHLSDGTTIWEKPHYGSEDCTDYLNCRRATLIPNPAWNHCSPEGISYEVVAVDGKPVLDASAWEITEPTSKISAYVGFACGQGFSGPSLSGVSNQTAGADCLSRASAAPPGVTVAAALTLGAAYFNYRAAYNRPVHCVADQLSATASSTKCY
jgi:hypothetical protein